MHSHTLATRSARSENLPAALLAIGGWVGVFVIMGAASLLAVAAALLVFGSALLSHV